MINKLISVIVPVYNVEQYVERCINSIRRQTYVNIEVIIVDDGSTDGSNAICEDMKILDSRISVIKKKNGGLSDARNAGLRKASGEYISFIDGDDYIEDDMYEKMIDACERWNCQIAVCGRYDVYKSVSKPRFCLNKMKIYNGKNILKLLFENKNMDCSSCDKLFHRSILGEMYFLKGKTSEDLPFVYNVLKNTKRLIHIGTPKYYYCHRKDSISGKKFTKSRMDYLYFLNIIKRDLIEEKEREIIKYFYIIYTTSVIYLTDSISKSDLIKKEKIKYKLLVKYSIISNIISILLYSKVSKDDKENLIKTLFFT